MKQQMEFDLGDKKKNQENTRTREQLILNIQEKRIKNLPLDEIEQKLFLEEIEEERELRNREYGR